KTMKNFRQVNWCLAPGAGARFASFPIRGSQRCLAPGAGTRFASISIGDRKGAWHRVRGRDLPAFRFEIAKVPGTLVSPCRNASKSVDASGARHLGESPQECWQIR
ncbi:MAG: hypothetical protein DWH99_00910, partial [Planctomycetota bacterium]